MLTREEVESAMGNITPWTKKLKKAKIPIEKEEIDIMNAEGRVCASSLIPYPPGIPIVVAGEIVTDDVVKEITKAAENRLDLKWLD